MSSGCSVGVTAGLLDIAYSFLSCFVAFLRSEMKYSKLFVQPPHHLVTYAHHRSSFSFFWTSCDCFGTFMQLIIYNCLRTLH